MTDVDSTNNVSDAAGQPSQPQQGASSDKPNSLDVEALVEMVVKRLEPHIEKTVQSTKDKRFSKLEEALMERMTTPAVESKPQAVDPEPDGKATSQKGSTTVQTTPVGKPDEFTEAESVLLKQLGLDVTDPAVASVKDLPVVQRIMEYGKIVQRRAETPAPSAAIPQPGAQPVSKEAQYEELLRWQRNDPLDRTGNQARLKKELGI